MIIKFKKPYNGEWALFDNVDNVTYDTTVKDKRLLESNTVLRDFALKPDGKEPTHEHTFGSFVQASDRDYGSDSFFNMLIFHRKGEKHLVTFDTKAYIMNDDGKTIESVSGGAGSEPMDALTKECSCRDDEACHDCGCTVKKEV